MLAMFHILAVPAMVMFAALYVWRVSLADG
jgi:hypothetical protein